LRGYFCTLKSTEGDAMTSRRWLQLILAAILALLVLIAIRMHVAAGQQLRLIDEGNVEAGRLSAQAWCTECHSVQPETAGMGKFAPDFTVIAKRRSARWLHRFLQSKHTLMPDFVLNRTEANDLVAYIVSLKRS
jgi:mono/diheme cytochrome c family protein